jgi:hypothetical protein
MLEDRIVGLLSEARACVQDLAREADELRARIKAQEDAYYAEFEIVEHDPLDESTDPYARVL